MELTATPESTMPSGEIRVSFVSARIRAATSMLPAKARPGTSAPESVFAFNAMIANAAPKLAPCETPNVDAEASGFLKIACNTHPEAPSPAPAVIAVRILGSRLF